MSALTDFVEQENAYMKIFGRPPLILAIAKDRQEIAGRIDSQLSPENLTCDGELSRHAVQAKYMRLTKAAIQLKKVDPDVVFYEFSEEI
jgi:hypothetical protein